MGRSRVGGGISCDYLGTVCMCIDNKSSGRSTLFVDLPPRGQDLFIYGVTLTLDALLNV